MQTSLYRLIKNWTRLDLFNKKGYERTGLERTEPNWIRKKGTFLDRIKHDWTRLNKTRFELIKLDRI